MHLAWAERTSTQPPLSRGLGQVTGPLKMTRGISSHPTCALPASHQTGPSLRKKETPIPESGQSSPHNRGGGAESLTPGSSGFTFWPCHFLARTATSLSLSFFLRKLGVVRLRAVIRAARAHPRPVSCLARRSPLCGGSVPAVACTLGAAVGLSVHSRNTAGRALRSRHWAPHRSSRDEQAVMVFTTPELSSSPRGRRRATQASPSQWAPAAGGASGPAEGSDQHRLPRAGSGEAEARRNLEAVSGVGSGQSGQHTAGCLRRCTYSTSRGPGTQGGSPRLPVPSAFPPDLNAGGPRSSWPSDAPSLPSPWLSEALGAKGPFI